MKKLPQITLLFWVMKIAATTLGETGGDLLAQTLNIGYAVSSLLFIGLFLVSLVTQLKATNFHPALYWTVIVATSTAGTTMSDFINRSAGLGYAKGALVLITCLAIVFAVWRYSGQTFSVERISTFRGELLYWIAILFSNTLGTSLGDFLADSSGLGYAGGALVITSTMALILAAHYFTRISATLLFWMAFVLTRPLGATVGDFFSKPLEKGGLNLGTVGSSAALTAILLALIGYTLTTQRKPARQPVHALEEI
ncbi:MAG: COG4705 family protein [Pseudonocardiaceae bacterium]